MQGSEISRLQKAVGPHYRIVRRLAHNGDSSIYLLQSNSENAGLLALKVFNSVVPGTVEAKRIENEIRTACTVSHHNVIKGYQKLSTESLVGFAMEYAEGGNLAQLLNKQQRLAINEVLRLGAELCAGLEAIHARGIIHRNIGLSNLLFSKDGTLKIADFGVTQYTHEERITSHSDILGSFHYVSPEYLKTGHVDRRSDIYAVGMVLYELATGQRPFGASAQLKNLMRRLSEDPKPPTALREDCPPALERIIMKALMRNPAARYASATEMLKDFLAVRPSVKVESSLQSDDNPAKNSEFQDDLLEYYEVDDEVLMGSGQFHQKISNSVFSIYKQGGELLSDTKQLFSFPLLSAPTLVIAAVLGLFVFVGVKTMSGETQHPSVKKNTAKIKKNVSTTSAVPAIKKDPKEPALLPANNDSGLKRHQSQFENPPIVRPDINPTGGLNNLAAGQIKNSDALVQNQYKARSYTIESGDNLARIARKMNVSVEDIVELNEIRNPNILRIGTTILIPPESKQ